MKARRTSGLSERIREVAQRVGGVSELARRAGLPQSTVSNYSRNVSQPNVEGLLALARAGGVLIAWLATGESEGAERIEPLRTTQHPCECGCGAIVLESTGGGW